jgi:hypothetical protein
MTAWNCMNLRLEFQYTYDEFIEAQRAHTKGEVKEIRKRGSIWGWAIFIGLAVMFFLILQGRQPSGPARTTATRQIDAGPWTILLPILPWIGVALALWPLGYWALRRQRRKFWEGSAHLQQPRVVTVTDEMLTDATTLTSHAYRWAAFVKFHETTNLFVLYPTQYTLEIVPKRAFASPDDIQAFRAFLQERIAPPTRHAFPVAWPDQG